MLRCQDVVELLGDYLDEELDPATREALEQHLAGCRDCPAFFETYRGTVRTVRQLREGQLPAELRQRLMTFLQTHRDA